jgi:antitoxin YefM
MTTVSLSAFRANVSSYLEKAYMEPIHVTRQKAQGVVVMSEDEYDSIMETLHLLRSPRNAEHLLASIADANAGKLIEREI